MKKIINLLIIYFLFTTFSYSKISTDSQKSLINNNLIYIGLSCHELTNLLGGIKKVSTLFLGNKNQQKYQYALINIDNKEDYKVFYVCKKNRSNYENSSKVINVLMDQDVEKIFYDPVELFSYIFSITSDQSTKYIFQTLQKTEFNITNDELKLAHLKSMKKEKTSKYITKKKKKKKKKLTEQSIILENINNIKSGDYYLFAHSTNGEIFWGSTNRTTDTIQSGTVFSSNGNECLIASIQKTESPPYKGTFRLVCNNKKIEGSWTQKNNNSPGLGKAFTDNGDIINAFFSKNRNEINKFVKSYYTTGETKIADVVEQEQEEIKIVTKKLDKTPPNLITKENITVTDTTYFITGEIKDEGSEILYLKIEDDITQVKNGKFEFKRFSIVDEKITIVAIDQWGNESKPKIINVKINIKDTLPPLEKLKPEKLRTTPKSNKVAIIFGIEEYEKSSKATYAKNDGQYFYEYARKGFGINKENIKLLIDKEANRTNTYSTLDKWLPPRIKKNQTELLIFFSGHGLASNDGEEIYILPQDSDADLLKRTAISRKELFEIILALEPKSVTMFFDTCYNGSSRDGEILIADARPLIIVPDEQPDVPKNFTIFSASELEQISSPLKEAKHGIFSYYVMKGLEGNADMNNDRKISNGELLSYLKDHVPLKASELDRIQTPTLNGDPDKILIRY